tara:strand:- start:1693 stop:2412 length:720 start_codon:yes stop_codon:yes gene_type:complete
MDDLPTKTQYIIIDSEHIQGQPNNFTYRFDYDSSIHVEDMTSVVGLKVVDFFISQIGSVDSGNTGSSTKYVDLICPTIPKIAQLLTDRGEILTRIPLERNSSGPVLFHDKQWNNWTRRTIKFNPISIKNLEFRLNEFKGDDTYGPLQHDARFYMIIEVITLDTKIIEKKEEEETKLVKTLKLLCKRLEDKKFDPPPQPKKVPLFYIGIFISIIVGLYLYLNRSKAPNFEGMSKGPPLGL